MSYSITKSLVHEGKLLVHVAENGHSFELECNENTLVEAVMRLIESDAGAMADIDMSKSRVVVLCITKSEEVLNYQAFINTKGIYTVAETMPESDRWDACLARPISSFHEHYSHLSEGSAGVKFTYKHPSSYFHTERPFIYRHGSVPTYCI